MIKNLYPRPEFKTTVNAANARNVDIVDAMEKNFFPAVKVCKDAHKLFKGATPRETAAKIWLYLRNYAKYKRDPDATQLIRLPNYFVHVTGSDGKPFADCKTFALFVRANFAAIYPELPTAFAFTNYDSSNGTTPTHVYTLVKDYNGKTIIVDGCWPQFDSQKNFNFMVQPKFKKMDVLTLSGTNRKISLKELNERCSPEVRKRIVNALQAKKRLQLAKRQFATGRMLPATYNAIQDDIAQTMNAPRKKKKLTKAERKAKRKRSNEKAKKVFLKIGRGLNTVNLAPVRGAFTAIVALNVNALATNLKTLRDTPKLKDDWNKIVKVWLNLGGFEKALNKAINIGAKKKILFMSKKAKARFEKRTGQKTKKGRIVSGVEDETTINIAPAVLAAVLATATTIVGAMVPIITKALQKNGQQAEADAVQAQGEEIVEQAQTKGLRPFADAQAAPYNPEPGTVESDEAPEYESDDSEDGTAENDGSDLEGESAETITGYIYGGVGKLDPELQNQLFDSLGKVVGEGIKFTAAAVAKKKKKNPKLKKVLDAGGAAVDDYLTGRYLREAGVTPKAKKAASFYTANKGLIFAGGGLALGGLVVWLISGRKK